MKGSYISASCKSSVSNVVLVLCYSSLKLDHTFEFDISVTVHHIYK